MSQRVAWRCSGCESVVTAPVPAGWTTPECPMCGQIKDASPISEGPASDARGYDTRAEASFAATAGPEIDRSLAIRVLGGDTPPSVPPYSSEDWAATALAELIGRQSAWSFHLTFCRAAWTATFTEKAARPRDPWSSGVSAFVCASGRTRAIAICRAIWKVSRSPRWTPLAERIVASTMAPDRRDSGVSVLPS